MRYVNKSVNWKNNYQFTFQCHVGDKSHITDFMVKHKMFPGSTIKCTLDMQPCNAYWNSPTSLRINVEVWHTIYLQDKFSLDQGTFCKVMSNIYHDPMSTMIN